MSAKETEMDREKVKWRGEGGRQRGSEVARKRGRQM